MAENKKRVSIGLTDKQYELVEKLAKEKGFSKSAIFVLADGMGGYSHGEIAAQTVATKIVSFIEKRK